MLFDELIQLIYGLEGNGLNYELKRATVRFSGLGVMKKDRIVNVIRGERGVMIDSLLRQVGRNGLTYGILKHHFCELANKMGDWLLIRGFQIEKLDPGRAQDLAFRINGTRSGAEAGGLNETITTDC